MVIDVRPTSVTTRGLTLRGTAYVPGTDSRHPTAMLFHGFGGQRSEASRAFVQLARALVTHGIAAVAFDRAGHGESDGDFADSTVSQDVVDSMDVLEGIASLDFVDRDDLHLVGISLGAVVASVVAAQSDVHVRSLTMWSVAAVFVDEIRGGHLQGRPTDELDPDGCFDFRGQRLGPAFFTDARDFDVYGRASGFAGPVRVLHGDQDFVPSEYAARYVDIYGRSLDFTLVNGADHCWESVPARDLVLAETVAFVRSHTRRPER